MIAQVRNEFLLFLEEASGTLAHSLTGLSLVRSQVMRLPTSPDNPNPRVAWGIGDPNVRGNILSRRPWRRNELLVKLDVNGVARIYLGWFWATLVYDRWEDSFRHHFAKELNCEVKEVTCDAM